MVAVGQRMSSSGLSPGKSGNLSVRVDGGMLITPTGIPYAEMRAADIVEVRTDGRVQPGQRVASSEWRVHLGVYKARPDVGAIMHTHSLNATALSCLHRGIPAFHYMVAEFGGERVACAPYATYGSEELARFAVKALGPRSACLLANHGSIALGESVRQAYDRAAALEALAAQYARALQIGRPRILSGREMARVIEKFKTYGKQTPVKS
ncbi:MAG: class II aldolase [Alphaproteobacteria bacterium]|nr:class II aldolase [Alphaproteobacteria bacterium]